MPAKDATADGWTRVAAGYDLALTRYTGRFAEDALRWAGVREGWRVLDVAAGAGALALPAARLGADVLAVDSSTGMVERLRRRAAGEKLALLAEVMDGQDLRLPPGGFQAVFCLFGLMFFPDPGRGLAEMRRVAAAAAPLLATTWGPGERVPFVDLFGAALRETHPALAPRRPPPILSLADAEGLARLARSAGWEDVEVEPRVHPWRHRSREDLWENLCAGAPAIQVLLERIGPEGTAALRAALLRQAASYVEGTEVVLPCQANVLTGRA